MTSGTSPNANPKGIGLTSKYMQLWGTTFIELLFAQLAIALGSAIDFNVLGIEIEPLAWLKDWGESLQQQASDAYAKGIAAQATADQANNTANSVQTQIEDYLHTLFPDNPTATMTDAGNNVLGKLAKSTWDAFVQGTVGSPSASDNDLVELIQGKLSLSDFVTQLTGSDGTMADAVDWMTSNFLGDVDPSRLPVIPLPHITLTSPNLVTNGGFDTPGSLDGEGVWSWDGTVGRDAPGSAKVVADGNPKALNSKPIGVRKGDHFTATGYATWEGFAASAGQALQLIAATYLKNVQVAENVLAHVDSPAASADWTELTGDLVIPDGVDSVRVRLAVTDKSTAGTVHWDDISATKTGLLPSDYVTNLPDLIASLFGGSTVGSTVQASAIPDVTKDMSSGIQSLINGIVEHFGAAQDPTDATQPDANMAMGAVFTTLRQTVQAVQDLQSKSTQTDTTGSQLTVDFSAYPDGPLPSIFTAIYSGSGTSSVGVVDGKLSWTTVADAERFGIFRINTPTVTDYQKFGFVGTSGPDIGASEYAFTRMNAAGDTYVYARAYCEGFLDFKAEIGCVVAGVKHVWATDISMPLNISAYLVAGTAADPYTFQILSGDSIAYTYADSAHQSQLGEDYRYWALGGEVTVSGGKAAKPGDIASLSVVDHLPPTIIGTTFRARRAAVLAGSLGSGDAELPNGSLDAVDVQSLDLTWDGQGVTVAKEGTYMAVVHVILGSLTSGQGGYATVYKNGTLQDAGPWVENQAISSSNANSIHCTGLIYCVAGDVITPGSHLTAAKGVDQGSYFELTLVNP